MYTYPMLVSVQFFHFLFKTHSLTRLGTHWLYIPLFPTEISHWKSYSVFTLTSVSILTSSADPPQSNHRPSPGTHANNALNMDLHLLVQQAELFQILVVDLALCVSYSDFQADRSRHSKLRKHNLDFMTIKVPLKAGSAAPNVYGCHHQLKDVDCRCPTSTITIYDSPVDSSLNLPPGHYHQVKIEAEWKAWQLPKVEKIFPHWQVHHQSSKEVSGAQANLPLCRGHWCHIKTQKAHR